MPFQHDTIDMEERELIERLIFLIKFEDSYILFKFQFLPIHPKTLLPKNDIAQKLLQRAFHPYTIMVSAGFFWT